MAVSRETLIESYFPEKKEEILRYAHFLTTVGIERGVIGPKESEIIWERHIFNSLPVISLIPEGVSVVDIGSGAGLPGIPIALARPDLAVTLVEPLQRRYEFLLEAVEGLGITVFHGRAQDYTERTSFITARAVAPLGKLVAMNRHLINKGGVLLAIKGESASEEVKSVPGAQLHEISLESLPLSRVISVAKRA